MKHRSIYKRLTASLLSIAIILTLLPVTAMAAIADKDSDMVFKNMYLHSAMNQRPISTYMYGDSMNYINTATTLDPSTPGGLEWMLLTFAIDKSQNIDLELYKLSDELSDEDLLEFELAPNPDLIPEDFLVGIQDGGTGENAKPLYLVTRRFWGNIDPAEADASTQVEKAADYIRADLDVFNYELCEPTFFHDQPAYGHHGEPFEPAGGPTTPEVTTNSNPLTDEPPLRTYLPSRTCLPSRMCLLLRTYLLLRMSLPLRTCLLSRTSPLLRTCLLSRTSPLLRTNPSSTRMVSVSVPLPIWQPLVLTPW